MSTYDEYRVVLDAREEGDERRAQEILGQIDQVAYVRASWKRPHPSRPRFVVLNEWIDDERPMDADEMREERLHLKRLWRGADWLAWKGYARLGRSPFYGVDRSVQVVMGGRRMTVIADPDVPIDRPYMMQSDPVVLMNPAAYEALQQRFGQRPRGRMPTLRESLAAALRHSEDRE